MGTPCTKCGLEVYWYPAINEEGWRCCHCGDRPGEPPGFDPARDREDIYLKCYSLLSDLADANLISVSNGSHGDGWADAVAAKCRETGLYDQTSILRFFFEGDENHANYWRKVSEGVLSGNDPRRRCDAEGCNALANAFSGGNATCLAHWRLDGPESQRKAGS